MVTEQHPDLAVDFVDDLEIAFAADAAAVIAKNMVRRKSNPDLSERAHSPHGVALTGICSANQN